MKIRFFPLLVVSGFFLCFSSRLSFAAEATDVPAGSEAGVIEATVRDEAQEELFGRPEEPTPVHMERAAAPEEEKAVRFTLQKINLVGLEEILKEEEPGLREVLAAYQGKEVGFQDIMDLKQELERYFLDLGYFVYVFIPPQTVSGGVLTLQGVAARMGELKFEGEKYFRLRRTRRYWRIQPGEVLNKFNIQKGIFAMSQNPDRAARPKLVPGKEFGVTDVTIQLKETFPVHPSFTLDNRGVSLTGKERFGFTVRHNNMLGLDDILSVGTVFGEEYGTFSINHLIPMTSFGTSFIWGFSHAQVNPKEEFEPFGINGISQTYSLMLRQRWVISRRALADFNVAFRFKDRTTRVQSVTPVWDRLRVLSMGAQWMVRDEQGFWVLNQEASFGLPLHGDGFPLTSRGAETSFVKFDVGLHRSHRLPFGITATLSSEAQLSPDKLPPQEQRFIGGARTVRGYPESDYGADQMLLNQLELEVPLFLVPKNWTLPWDDQPLRDRVKLIAFLDHGYGRQRDPSATASRTRNMLGVGGGFSFEFRENLSLRLEWGAPLMEEPLTESAGSQFHFRLQADV